MRRNPTSLAPSGNPASQVSTPVQLSSSNLDPLTSNNSPYAEQPREESSSLKPHVTWPPSPWQRRSLELVSVPAVTYARETSPRLPTL